MTFKKYLEVLKYSSVGESHSYFDTGDFQRHIGQLGDQLPSLVSDSCLTGSFAFETNL